MVPVIVIAHRGASAYAPENTLAAFREARQRGADMVELDVRQTADGEFVAVHDETLRRTTDARHVFPRRRPWRVADFTMAEIRRLDAGSWFDARFSGERVPTLEEALWALRAHGLGALVELKPYWRDPALPRRLAGCLAGDPYWHADSRLVVQSFNRGAMRELSEYLPSTRRAVLTKSYSGFAARRVAEYAQMINPHFVRVSASYVRYVHSLGLSVFSWTANSDSAIRRVISSGVDGVISDYPDRVARGASTAVSVDGG